MAEIVVPMKLEHVMSVVDVHLQSFRGFFLTFLGRDFLFELYRGIVADPSGIAFVAVADECVVGFVAGIDHPVGFYKRLLRKCWWRFGLASLIPILKNPLIILRLLRAIRKPQDVSNQLDTGTLMSVAVSPETQGRGLGQALVKAFLEEATDRGLKHVDLTTDKNNNDYVNQFYQRMGFRCSRSFVTSEGREMNEYVIGLYRPKNILR
jgi:ribosomal protein S18 acetylase RimI-like enzyme